MTRIQILPEILTNKIAAGEVVERPASVVKELCENALDAGAKRIVLEIKNGGKKGICITDDGTGMSRDDALLSLERYATSKIRTDPDLFSISTLGFRGEALPSIASVSRFTMETRDTDSVAGTQIHVSGGKLTDVKEAGMPKGTRITVNDLFFNTPARRKFMKSVNTETAHIASVISSMALGWPGVDFRFVHNNKTVKDWPAAGEMRTRVLDVLGLDVRESLMEAEYASGDIRVAGWVVSPKITRSTSGSIYLFVNNRHITNRLLTAALFKGYGNTLFKGRFPVAVLFVHLPYDTVDVNVHPAKREVRFAESARVFSAVETAVKKALASGNTPFLQNTGSHEEKSPPSHSPVPGFNTPKQREEEQKTGDKPHPAEPAPGHGQPVHISKTASQLQKDRDLPDLTSDNVHESVSEYKDCNPANPGLVKDSAFHETSLQEGSREKKTEEKKKPPVPRQVNMWESAGFSRLHIIGQFHNSYILCESRDELILIDQHAAHERILFENLKNRRMEKTRPEVQQLAVKETIDLGVASAGILEEIAPGLKEMGLEIEPFGGTTFAVSAVPAFMAGKDARKLLVEITDAVMEIGVSFDMGKAMDACLALIACHGAVRANSALNHEQMKSLLSRMDGCEDPSHCPHGRPTWIKWPLHFLEKAFKRIP